MFNVSTVKVIWETVLQVKNRTNSIKVLKKNATKDKAIHVYKQKIHISYTRVAVMLNTHGARQKETEK